MRKILFVGKIQHNIARGDPTTKIYWGKAPEKEKKEMNTSKRIQRPILLAIAAVLALALLVSTAVILAFADETPADSISISLDGKINVNFKLATSKVEGYTAASAKIGDADADVAVETDGNRTIFTVALMPYQMAETVELTLTKEGADDIVKSTTVVDYAKKIIGSNNAATAAWGDAARALLNYGAMTQVDKGHNTDALANAGVFTKNNPIDGVTDITSEALVAKEGNLEGKIRLSFTEGDIALKYVINYEGDAEIKAAVDGQSIALVNKNDGTYEFKITNIGVNDFAKAWTVDITAGADSIKSVRSVLQYLDYNAFDAESEATDTEKDVCKALYQLYQYTVANPDQTACEHDVGGYAAATVKDDLTFGESVCKCMQCAKEMHFNANYDGKCDVCATTEGITDPGALKLDYNDLKDAKLTDATIVTDTVLKVTATANKNNTITWLNESDSTHQLSGGRSTLDIGDARYAVIKMKTDKYNTFNIQLSTTNSDKVSKGYFLRNALFSSNRDVIYVVDLNGEGTAAFMYNEGLTPDEDGTRTLDTLIIHAGGTQDTDKSISIEYIAFSNDLGAELAALIGEDTSPIFVLDRIDKETEGAGMAGHTITKNCLLGAHINNDCNGDTKCDFCGIDGISGKNHKNEDCNTVCDVCETELGTQGTGSHEDFNFDSKCDNCGTTVTNSGALVIDCGKLDPSKLVVKQATASTEDGALHFAFASPTAGLEVTLLNSTKTKLNGHHSEINIGSARYVMIKMKSDRTGTMNLQLSTTDGGTMKKCFTRGTAYSADSRNVYRIFVIDLNMAGNDALGKAGLRENEESTNSLTLTQINLYMGRIDGTEVDIDYIAFAEDLSDVKAKVVADGDDALTVYEVGLWPDESTSANTVRDLSTIS